MATARQEKTEADVCTRRWRIAANANAEEAGLPFRSFREKSPEGTHVNIRIGLEAIQIGRCEEFVDNAAPAGKSKYDSTRRRQADPRLPP